MIKNNISNYFNLIYSLQVYKQQHQQHSTYIRYNNNCMYIKKCENV